MRVNGIRPNRSFGSSRMAQPARGRMPIRRGFTMLTRRELFIILKRFYSDPPVTLMEIGSQLGLSQERVRQLQVRSLQKMKQFLENQEISPLKAHDLTSCGSGEKACRLAGE